MSDPEFHLRRGWRAERLEVCEFGPRATRLHDELRTVLERELGGGVERLGVQAEVRHGGGDELGDGVLRAYGCGAGAARDGVHVVCGGARGRQLVARRRARVRRRRGPGRADGAVARGRGGHGGAVRGMAAWDGELSVGAAAVGSAEEGRRESGGQDFKTGQNHETQDSIFGKKTTGGGRSKCTCGSGCTERGAAAKIRGRRFPDLRKFFRCWQHQLSHHTFSVCSAVQNIRLMCSEKGYCTCISTAISPSVPFYST